MPVLETLVSDPEFVVRQHLAAQFGGAAAVRASLRVVRHGLLTHPVLTRSPICSGMQICRAEGGEEGYQLLVDTILPTLCRLVSDPQSEAGSARSCSAWQCS